MLESGVYIRMFCSNYSYIYFAFALFSVSSFSVPSFLFSFCSVFFCFPFLICVLSYNTASLLILSKAALNICGLRFLPPLTPLKRTNAFFAVASICRLIGLRCLVFRPPCWRLAYCRLVVGNGCIVVLRNACLVLGNAALVVAEMRIFWVFLGVLGRLTWPTTTLLHYFSSIILLICIWSYWHDLKICFFFIIIWRRETAKSISSIFP